MKRLMKVIMSLFLLCVFLFSVIFSFFNTQPVVVSLGYFELPSLPLSVWILGAFAAGGLVGLLLGAGSMSGMRARRELNRLKAKQDSATSKVNVKAQGEG